MFSSSFCLFKDYSLCNAGLFNKKRNLYCITKNAIKVSPFSCDTGCFHRTDDTTNARACLKNHFRNLRAPLCGIFYPHSVDVARYAALIRIKSPTNWDSQLTKSLFQTRSNSYVGYSLILA